MFDSLQFPNPIHTETIANRVRSGWSLHAAETTPIRSVRHRDGRVNIAAIARANGCTPSKVQRLIRSGLSLNDALKAAKE